MVPKVAGIEQPIKVLHAVHTEVSVEAGQGQAAVPPSYTSPLVYTPLPKDPDQGLRYKKMQEQVSLFRSCMQEPHSPDLAKEIVCKWRLWQTVAWFVEK